jgi:hypothetical protein
MALSALETPRGSPLPPFKWRHFEGAVILLCIRWYLRYALSDREVEELVLWLYSSGHPETKALANLERCVQ